VQERSRALQLEPLYIIGRHLRGGREDKNAVALCTQACDQSNFRRHAIFDRTSGKRR